ncbi:MAG: MerC domain-containing protein [Phycisphaeraceae bacterium]
MSTSPRLQLAELGSNPTERPVADPGIKPGDHSGGDRAWLDRVGITASVACAIHCLAAPFLLLLLPAAGSVWAHPAVHWVLAVLVLPLAVWVIYRGYLKHRKRWTLVAAGIGSACIVAGLIAPMLHDQPVLSLPIASGESNAAAAGLILADAGAIHTGAEAGPACTEASCPTITEDAETGAKSLAMPPGGFLTLIGSLFLVFAHASNLIACRCYSRDQPAKACGDSGCGCPA